MGMPDSLFEPEPLQSEAAECIAFVGDEQTHGVVSSVLQQFFADAVVRNGDSSAALAYLAEVPAPKVVIVDIGESSQPLSAMLSLTAAFTDDTRLIGIGEINDIALYRELTEAGVTDYLVKPVSEKALAAALSRSEEVKAAAATTPKAAPSEVHKIVVMGARGGVGASTTAVNLAWIFAEEKGIKTALVDLDLEFGTIALSLDLEPTRGLREALETPARIDNLFISSATAKLTDNLSIMATEENLAHGHSFNPNAVEILFETLAHENGCIIVDLPRALYSVRDQVLGQATRIILVTELSLPALRDSIRLLGIVEDAAPKKPITVIANRCKGGQQAMGQSEFQKALGRKVDLMISDESKVFNDAANTGKAVVSHAGRSKAAKSLRSVAAIVASDLADDAPKAKKKSKSWLKLGNSKKPRSNRR
jgi:pilus assembly protein CpaE